MRARSPLAIAFAVLALVVLAGPAHAADDPHGGGGGSLLVPNFYVAGATIAVFVLLLIVLSKTAWKPILAGLRAREQGIRDQIEGAEKANAAAKALLADYEARLAHVNDEARAILEEGRKDANLLKAKIETDAKAEAQRERERAVRDIELARQQALKDIYDQVATLSTDIAGKILQQRLDPASHRRLVDDAVASYERSRKAPGSGGGSRA
jgi:F-type H+-transporting ATPase subunit b